MAETDGLVDRVDGLIATASAGREGFAAAVGLDGSRLSAALDGSGRFSSLDLALIADAHHVTGDWLLTGEPSVLMRGAHLPAGSARSLVERAEDLSDRREGTVLLGASHRWRSAEPPVIGGPAEQGSALAAAALRRVRDAGRDVAELDLPAVVEDVFGVDVAVHDVGPGIDGLAVSATDVRLLVVAATAASARQRLALARGLGRLLAGDVPDVLHLDLDVDENSDDPAEVRSDVFACCLLMPEDVLARAAEGGLSEASFVALVGGFGTSPSLLAWRLMDLGLVDVEVGKRWGAMTAAEAARTGGWGDELSDVMARALAPRAPRLLRHDLYRVYEAGEATVRAFASILGTDPDRLREMLGSDLG